MTAPDFIAPQLEPTFLTATDIAALRHANRICFRHIEGGACTVEAIKTAPDPTPRNPFPIEGRCDIQATTEITHYGQEYAGALNRSRGFAAFAMEYVYSHLDGKDPLTTFTRFLKPGDALCLKWTASNNNETMKAAGLHLDTLTVIVNRPRKNKPPELFAFLVSLSVCPNNSARMIRQA